VAIASVFSVSASSNNSKSVTTSAVNTTGATFLVLGVSTAAAVSITDSFGNTYSLVGNSSNGAYLYSCANPTVGSGHTFTATTISSTASGYPSIAAVGFSGVGAFYQVSTGLKTDASQNFTDSFGIGIPTSSDKCLAVLLDGMWGTDYGGNLVGPTSLSTNTTGYSLASSTFVSGKSTGIGLAYGTFATGSTLNVAWSVSPATAYSGFRVSAIWYPILVPPKPSYLSIGAVQPGTSSGISLGYVSIGAVQPSVPLTQNSFVGVSSQSVVGSTTTIPNVSSSIGGQSSLIVGQATISGLAVTSSGIASLLVVGSPKTDTPIFASSGIASSLVSGGVTSNTTVVSQIGSASSLNVGNPVIGTQVSSSSGISSVLVAGSPVAARVPSVGFVSIGAVQPGTGLGVSQGFLSIGAIQPSVIPSLLASAGIPSTGQVGTVSATASVTVQSGIASTAVVGSPVRTSTVQVSAGIAATSAVGQPITLASLLQSVGIASTLRTGTPAVSAAVSLSAGIGSSLVVGTANLTSTITISAGVASSLQVGQPTIWQVSKYFLYVTEARPRILGANPVVPRNANLSNLPIGRFVSIATGQEVTSGTVSATYYANGVSGSVSGSATYDATGQTWVWSQVPAAVMNADLVGLSFSITGCMPVFHLLSTEVSTYLSSSVASGSISTTSFTGDSYLSSQGGFYVGSVLLFTSGALSGMARRISGYDGVTKVLTFATAWPTIPSLSDTFIIMGRIE